MNDDELNFFLECNKYIVFSVTNATKAAWQNFPQIKRIKIVQVYNSFPTNYPYYYTLIHMNCLANPKLKPS